MHEAYLEIVKANDAIGTGLSVIFFATFYIIAKTTIWWLLFGTGRLLFGKYTIAEWGIRTLIGLVGFSVLILFCNGFIWLFDKESNVYLVFWGISLFLSLRIWIRELFSLGGLLKGDWNPFHPQLRFFGFDEEYIMDKFRMTKERRKQMEEDDKRRRKMERDAAYYYEGATW